LSALKSKNRCLQRGPKRVERLARLPKGWGRNLGGENEKQPTEATWEWGTKGTGCYLRRQRKGREERGNVVWGRFGSVNAVSWRGG